jgi:tartrate dehydratase alpha subunit/fumarate hydratase class I-like protein
MKIIDQNIALAKNKSQPICQDTGSIIFYIAGPVGLDQIAFEAAAKEAVKVATKKGYLRQNSVDSLTGKNDGTNVGPGSPTLHFHQHRSPEVVVRLILKGGGCENVGRNTPCQNEKLKANRDLDGCRKAILDAVCRPKARVAAPASSACASAATRNGYEHSKQQLLRRLDDTNRIRTWTVGKGHRRDRNKLASADGLWRPNHPPRRQNRSAQPPAGFVFRQRQLHVLGLPAPGRLPRSRRRHCRLALLRVVQKDSYD